MAFPSANLSSEASFILPPRMTAEEFFDWQASLEERRPYYELHQGKVCEMPTPILGHQEIISYLTIRLVLYLQVNPIGKFYDNFSIKFDDWEVRVPDLVFVTHETLRRISPKGFQSAYWTGPPELCVEVISQGASKRDLQEKKDVYARCGVLEYWVIDWNKRQFHCFSRPTPDAPFKETFLKAGKWTGSPVLPGFSLDVDELWRQVS